MSESSPDAELRGLLDEHRQAQSQLKNMGRISQAATLLLAIVVVGFLVLLYGRISTMYAAENFEEPLRSQAAYLLPKIEPELRILWRETAPVYERLASEKLADALPVIQEATHHELGVMLTNVRERATRRVDLAVHRVAERHYEGIRTHVPNLADPDRAQERGSQWMEAISEDLTDVVVHLNQRYLDDLGELEATLEQFFPNEFESMSEDQLTRQFIHLWLMKMDHLVMERDNDLLTSGSRGGDHAS